MTDYADIREKLETRQRELRLRVERIEGSLRRASHPDSEERATENENDEVLERLDERGLAELAGIDEALSRMDEGAYGRCQKCKKEIPAARLEALPFATTCIRCAGD